MTDVPNQSTKTTDQNFEIDINKLYEDWISPIDAIRSYASVNTASTMKTLLGTNDTNISGFIKLIKVETTLQESRCHAFYRWIGFPVVSGDGTIYNPGFDIISCALKHKEISAKLKIANEPINGFNDLSDVREKFVKDNLQTFSLPLNITASAVALSSGGTQSLRKFSSPFETYKAEFDVKVKLKADDQKHVPNITSRVGSKTDIKLSDYKSAGGDKPDAKKLGGRFHIIRPFIVDPRIEFSVTPQSRLVAVPFVPDNSHLKSSSTSSVRRPLIEKFIRDRQPLKDPANAAGDSVNKITDYVSKTSIITNKELISKMQSKPNLFKSQNDQNQFVDILYQIEAMMDELAQAKKIIHNAQGFYYWVPEPSRTGPEGGSKVLGVFFPTYISTTESHELITDKDSAILEAAAKDATNNINIDSADVTGEPNSDEYGVSVGSSITFSSTTASGMGNNNSTNKEALSKAKLRILSEASVALRTVEIIMGEFSGLGLCDIIAITGALKIMPMENLLAFLDDEAYKRMQISILGQKSDSLTARPSEPSFAESMKVFEGLVKDFYNIMNSFYEEAVSGKK